MRLKKYIIPVFILVVLIQIVVPFKMIWDKEKVLSQGKIYRFKTAPIDPNDPFRGKYIRLNFDTKLTRFPKRDSTFKTIKTVYVTYLADKDGYAQIENVYKNPPAHTDYYLEVPIAYYDYHPERSNLILTYPFTKFYMQEHKAPKAEKVYRQLTTPALHSYATVSIYKGQAALINVFINDKPIDAYLIEKNEAVSKE